MTGVAEFLGRLVQRLDAADVPYMLSGSMASAVHGRPRATQDLDLIVDLNPLSAA